jgi:hypothetical protein
VLHSGATAAAASAAAAACDEDLLLWHALIAGATANVLLVYVLRATVPLARDWCSMLYMLPYAALPCTEVCSSSFHPLVAGVYRLCKKWAVRHCQVPTILPLSNVGALGTHVAPIRSQQQFSLVALQGVIIHTPWICARLKC